MVIFLLLQLYPHFYILSSDNPFLFFNLKFFLSHPVFSPSIFCIGFYSAGYSASSVEKYHYHSDCHRHIRSNLILIAGVLAILKYRNHGVPAKVAIIRNKVLVNDLFNFQAKRLPFLLSGMNPFTHLDKGV